MADDSNLIKVIEEFSKQVNSKLDLLAADVNGLKTDVGSLKSDVGSLKSEMVEVRKTQGEHTEMIDALTGDILVVQKKVDVLPDQMKLYYENNKRDINDIRKKLNMPVSPLLTEQSEFSH